MMKERFCLTADLSANRSEGRLSALSAERCMSQHRSQTAHCGRSWTAQKMTERAHWVQYCRRRNSSVWAYFVVKAAGELRRLLPLNCASRSELISAGQADVLELLGAQARQCLTGLAGFVPTHGRAFQVQKSIHNAEDGDGSQRNLSVGDCNCHDTLPLIYQPTMCRLLSYT